MAEWAQEAAIASLRLMEILKIGGSQAEKLPDGDRPLSGVRVLDLTRVLAPQRRLAKNGDDVPKITAPHLSNIGEGAVKFARTRCPSGQHDKRLP
jgi:hypothetical protein